MIQMHSIKNQKGLTLVELLAVVVILGILAAIAVPTTGKIIENTKKDAIIANAIQVIHSVNLAKAGGIDPSAISTAEDIKDFIEPFSDPFGNKNVNGTIPLNNISIDMSSGEPVLDLMDFGCGDPATSNEMNLSRLTHPDARDACEKP